MQQMGAENKIKQKRMEERERIIKKKKKFKACQLQKDLIPWEQMGEDSLFFSDDSNYVCTEFSFYLCTEKTRPNGSLLPQGGAEPDPLAKKRW